MMKNPLCTSCTPFRPEQKALDCAGTVSQAGVRHLRTRPGRWDEPFPPATATAAVR